MAALTIRRPQVTLSLPVAVSRRYVPYYSFDEAMRWTHALLTTVRARPDVTRPSPAGAPRRD